MKPAAVLIGFFICCLALSTPAESVPSLQLANVYEGDVDPADYWVSEKLDGVRAYWDGTNLLSRSGNAFNAPHWFTADFPDTPLDGELWMGRGTFAELSGAVRREVPDARQWRRIKYMVFDLPGAPGDFDKRLAALTPLVETSRSPYLRTVPQFKVEDAAALRRKLLQVVARGGEGLMLHRAAATYRGTRSNDLLKLKLYRDAEAVVIGHIEGNGKYRDILGALLVETPDGIRFRIGTGFTDDERADPPPIGSTITYKYFGTTRKGIPRFASFMRVREAE